MGQNRYDVPHSIHAVQRIKELKPDAIFLELPERPFQDIINKYLRGGTEKSLLKDISEAVGKELDIDHTLIEKFEKGHMSIKQLELIEPDASFVHIVVAAKKLKIPVYAIDVPMPEIEAEVRTLMRFSETSKDKAIRESREVLMGIKPVAFMRWAHEPFNFLEILIGHHPEKDPFNHPVECGICKLGVSWERFAHGFGAFFAGVLPVNKTLVALRHFDLVRENRMAKKIVSMHDQLKKKKEDPDLFAILHVWHEGAVESLISKSGIKVTEIE